MSIPRGVTVRQLGDPRPIHQGPRNVLEAAAMMHDRDNARRLIEAALGLDPNTVRSEENVSKQYRWERIGPASRLMEIAEWIKAECFDVIDLAESPTVSTLGD